MGLFKRICRRWGYLAVIATFWGGFFLYLRTPAEKREIIATLDCVFASEEGQGPIKLGSYTAPLRKARLGGSLRKSSQKTLHNFEGQALYLIDGTKLKAKATGSVFLDEQIQVTALIVRLEDSNFGRDDLSIVTLNEEGTLSGSSDRAYAYTLKQTKLAHPLAMDCTTRPHKDNGAFDWVPF